VTVIYDHSPIITIPDWVLLRGLALCFEDHWFLECHTAINPLQSDLRLPLIAEIVLILGSTRRRS
jgi:hypothetical protein